MFFKHALAQLRVSYKAELILCIAKRVAVHFVPGNN